MIIKVNPYRCRAVLFMFPYNISNVVLKGGAIDRCEKSEVHGVIRVSFDLYFGVNFLVSGEPSKRKEGFHD